MRVRLTREPLDAEALAREIADTAAGAVVTFAGVVRAERGPGGPLAALDYAAYEEMALREMSAIREQALRTHEVLDICIAHRLGRIALGEASVVVVVTAEHRAAAFDACREVIDALKTRAPIWKREIWSDGPATWVDPLT